MMRDRGKLVAVVSMDLSKAFDVIRYPLLLSKLRACGMDKSVAAAAVNRINTVNSRYYGLSLMRTLTSVRSLQCPR